MGQGAHLLTFPVRQGKLVNVVAFCTDDGAWKDYPQLTRPAKRDNAIADFKGFNSDVQKILEMVNSDLDCVCSNACPYRREGANKLIVGHFRSRRSPSTCLP